MHSGDWFLRPALGAAVLVLAGCPFVPGNPDGSAPPPDYCNSIQEALSDSQCILPLNAAPDGGLAVDQYINPPIVDGGSVTPDLDWYRVELPAGLTARDLIWIHGGYAAWPQTAVSFTLSVLTEPRALPDGGSTVEGLGRVIDHHGQGAPQDVGVLFRFPTAAAQRLVVEASDEMLIPTRPNFDLVHPYRLVAARVLDSDVNEPNDTAPAPIPLAPASGLLQGTATGTLAVNDDVDQFSFNVPAPGGPRKIAYVRLTAPQSQPPNPPIPYRLMFTLIDPNGTPISENIATPGSESMGTDLATARLAIPGTWKLIVQGYRPNGQTTPILGDPDQPYTVTVRVLDEQDANEPNDTQATATPITMTAPDAPAQQVTGRLDHIPDPDWYEVRIPASASPTLLHYKLRPTQTGGRFAPLVTLGDRELWTVSEVTGPATQQQRVAACQTDPGTCPQGWAPGAGENVDFQGQAMAMCQDHDPPWCLQSIRAESSEQTSLKNFEGELQVPAHAAQISYWLRMQDVPSRYADDLDYVLQVRWESDADEAGRTFSGGLEQRRAVAMAEDPNPAANGFPVPYSGANKLDGTISHGHGRVTDSDRLYAGDFVRGTFDYDAIPSDIDRWELDLPAADPSQPLDRTWELQWDVGRADGGAVYDLAVNVTFCDGDRLDGGSCTPVSTGRYGYPIVLAYTPDPLTSWQNVYGGPLSYQAIWDRQESVTASTITARAYGCFCFEPRFTRGGKLYLDVLAVDRMSYVPEPYELRTAITRYPMSYPVDGGTKSCPAPDAGFYDAGISDPDAGTDGGTDAGVPDAGRYDIPGCQFTNQ